MWFLPSYNRPEQCAAVLRTCVETGMTTPGVLLVQANDDRYESIELPPGWLRMYQLTNIGLSRALDYLFSTWADQPWFGLITDDHFPETQGWDLPLIAAAADKYIAHSDDGWQSDQRIFGLTVFGGDLLRALGRWAVPGTWHCYNDDLWEAIARDFPVRRYIKGIKVRSPHFMRGDVPPDDTYRAAYARFDADREAFAAYMASEARAAAWQRIGKLFPKAS
jgi:hypothetical protein